MSAELGLDRSGNGNNWTVTNLAYSDQMVDSPTNNFCTMNPLSRNISNTPVLSEGNLEQVSGASSTKGGTIGTMSMQSGKWYFEVYYKSHSTWAQFGVIDDAEANTGSIGTSSNPTNGIVYWNTGAVKKNGSTVQTDASWTAGDIIGIGYDTTNLDITFYKNGVRTNSFLSSAPKGNYTPYIAMESGTAVVNFGQDSSFAGNKTAQGNADENGYGDFYYPVPTWPASSAQFITLCTKNLPDVAVVPSEHFNTIAYTGDGNNTTITGVGFQPDLVWFKARNNAWDNALYDSVRGGSKRLRSNQTSAEDTSSSGYVSSFNSDGYAVVHGGSNHKNLNQNTWTYAAWNWKANGSGSSNTDGSITSTVSANVDAGFSIVSYNGGSSGTVGHGLSKTPELVIQRSRNIAEYWWTGTTVIDGSMDFLRLNDTNAKSDSGYSVPTSTVFSNVVYTGSTGNIAYCFHSVDGYSKVGSYTGNGNADGTFVYTGFRPAYVLIKRTDSTSSWWIQDTKRDTYNVADAYLIADGSGAEGTYTAIDFLSNGFKARNSSSSFNSGNHIYIAFAETPFKYSNAR